MNLRKVWTELFQKPAGCFSFSLAESSRLCLAAAWPQPKPDNTTVANRLRDEGIFLQ